MELGLCPALGLWSSGEVDQPRKQEPSPSGVAQEQERGEDSGNLMGVRGVRDASWGRGLSTLIVAPLVPMALSP